MRRPCRGDVKTALMPKSRGAATRATPSAQCLECSAACVSRLRAQFLLDPQQLIVFGRAIGASERAGLDLPAIGPDGEIGDSRILGLARAVRHDGGVDCL